jgi:hypothetical protein
VALQLSQIGHRESEIVEKGFPLLNFLAINGRYDHVMECLLNISPVFLANLETFWSSEMLRKTVEIIVTADLVSIIHLSECCCFRKPNYLKKSFKCPYNLNLF